MKDKDIRKDYKDGEINRLRARNKKLEREIRRLKSELNSFEEAFKKTTKFIKDHTDKLSLEDLIKAAKENKTLKQAQESSKNIEKCSNCLSIDVEEINLPFGKLVICNSCGFRKVERNND